MKVAHLLLAAGGVSTSQLTAVGVDGGAAGRSGGGTAASPARPRDGASPARSQLLELPDSLWHSRLLPLLEFADLAALRSSCCFLRQLINSRQGWLKVHACCVCAKRGLRV